MFDGVVVALSSLGVFSQKLHLTHLEQLGTGFCISGRVGAITRLECVRAEMAAGRSLRAP